VSVGAAFYANKQCNKNNKHTIVAKNKSDE